VHDRPLRAVEQFDLALLDSRIAAKGLDRSIAAAIADSRWTGSRRSSISL
jgi:hypothetical protein